MKIFLYTVRDHLTDMWHSGGAAAVIAPDETAAKELLMAKFKTLSYADLDGAHVDAFELLYTSSETPRVVDYYPDAGCC